VLFAQQPPTIDRDIFFDDPEISAAQLSPDGKYIAFMKPLNKTRNVWVKEAEAPFSSAKPVTADTKRPIPGYFWSRDGKYILFVQDQAGDENFNIYAVDPAAQPSAGSPAPPARNLTDRKGARAMIYAVPKSDPDTIWVGINDRDKAWHDLYKIAISTGELNLVRKNTDRVTSWVFDLKDQLRLATRSHPSGDTEILRVDADAIKPVYSCGVFETCAPIRFHKDNRRVYLITNRGDLNLIQLELLDPQTGNTQFVEADPLKKVDFSGLTISEVTDEPIVTIYNDEKPRRVWKDKSYEADYKRIQKEVPGAQVRFGSRTRDERLWLVTLASDTEPGVTYLYDRKTKKLTLQYKIREKLPREHMAEVKPIRYESAGGLEISAYLTLPKGIEPKKLPVIVLPHGGPWARDSWGFNGLAQFLANRGYAVLQPNFRGSAGFGKEFLNRGNNQWGEAMQDDITWGVKYLVQKEIADPKRVGIMGASYGGYATLAGLAFTPDLYAAGVDIVGPSNLLTLLNSIPPYWEAFRTTLYKRTGDPNIPADQERLKKQSPLFSADKIKAPLLVVQGANDPRVNQAEADQIVIALRDRGFPVEYLVAPDEGHGFARPVNNKAMFAAAERFLAKHLNGRYQQSMPDDVAARLKEITVDPKTVVLANKVNPGAVGLPQVAAGLTPGAYKYLAQIKMGEREMKLDTSTEIRREGDAWKVTDKVVTPNGEVVDEVVLDGKSLALLRRLINQGPMNFNLEVKGTKLTGSMKIQGNEKPVDVDLGGPLFADAAGAAHAIAALPLAEGYETRFRNFDVMKQKPKLMQLKVAGQEKVTVPAGTFDTWRVDITSAEGGPEKMTVWVAKDARKPVKTSAVMPQMGGATMTAELQ
jgi:dipeptidyl aminopeptidase/acylaminoacyl peptidase